MKKFFILILLFLVSGCVTIYNPATQRRETYLITEKSEISIGRNMAMDIIRTKGIIHNKKIVSRVKKIGKAIAVKSHRDTLNFEFYVLDDKQLNAFALPGGYIFVNKGLVRAVDDDELAFVLAHETGHVCARHSLKRMQSAMGINLVLGIALGDAEHALIRQAVGISYNVIASGYSRKDEYLADSLGLEYIIKAGYNSKGAISLLRKLEKLDKGGGLTFLRSHPEAGSRIEKLEEKIKDL